MGAAILTSLGTAVGASAATAAATGATIFGSVLSGVASGMMKGMEERRAEKQEQKRWDREADTYTGLGEAVQYWKQDSAEPGRKSREIAGAAPVGNRSDQVGNRYKQRAAQNSMPQPKYQFDRKQNKIVYQ